MFKKSSVGKMVQRRGAAAVKTLFRVHIHKVIFPRQPKDIPHESEISVCFERGGKIASSKIQKLEVLNDGSCIVQFEETLSLVVTMYREENGHFQEKIGNIVVRQKSKSLLGGEMYKGLGIATFNLDAIANNYRPTELSLPITQSSVKGAIVEISVTPKFLGESDGGAFDETMSMQSGISDNQINAAEFESIRGESGVFDDHHSEQLQHQDSMASSINSENKQQNQQQQQQQQQELDEMTHRYQSLSEEYDKQQKLYEKLENEFHQSEERSEEMAEQITSLEEQINKLNELMKRSETSSLEQMNQMKEKEEIIQKQQLEINEIRQEKMKIQENLEKQSQELEEMRGKEKEYEEITLRLQSTVGELSDSLSAMNSENGKLANVNEKFKEELETKNSVISLKDTEIRQLEGQLKGKEEEINEINESKRVLESEILTLKESYQTLKLTHENEVMQDLEEMKLKYEKQINELNEQILQQQYDYTELERQSVCQLDDMQSIEEEKKQLELKINELESTNEIKGDTLLSLQEELSSLTGNLTSSIEIIKRELSEEKEKHEEDLKQKNQIIKQFENEKNELNERLVMMNKRHEEEKEELEERGREAANKINELKEKIQQLEMNNQQLEDQLVSGQTETNDVMRMLSTSKSELEMEMKRLLVKHEEMIEENKVNEKRVKNEMEMKINVLNEEIMTLRGRVEEENNSLMESRNEIKELVLIRDALEEEKNSQMKLSEEKMKTLSDEMNVLKLSNESLVEEKKRLEEQVNELESLSLKQQEELSEERGRLEEKERQVRELECQNKELEEINQEFKEKNRKQNEEIELLVKEKENYQLHEMKLNERIHELESQQESQLSEREMKLQERISTLESQSLLLTNEMEMKEAHVKNLTEQLTLQEKSWNEEKEQIGNDYKSVTSLLQTIETERNNEKESSSKECEGYLEQINRLEGLTQTQMNEIKELNEEMRRLREEKSVQEERLNEMMIEKRLLEERLHEQEVAYASLQESLNQMSSHDQQLNSKYTTLLNEFHEYKIQQSMISSTAISDQSKARENENNENNGTSRVNDGQSSGSGSEEMKLNEILKLKIIFEEENIYLKHQIELLENEKEENEKSLLILQEKLNTQQQQLDQLLEMKQSGVNDENSSTQQQEQEQPQQESSTTLIEETTQTADELEELQMKIQQLQTENDELISHLIETKMQVATHASETDEERKKLFLLKRKLQLYAERVATLEVTVAERLAMNESTHGNNEQKKSRWGRKK